MATAPTQIDPETLRNLAITLGTQPRQIPPGAGQEPQMATPNLQIPSGPAPNLAISQPQVTAPRGTVEGDQAERARILKSGAGEDQIYGRVTGSQFGQAHPVLGKILGGLGEGVAKLGDVGLSAVAPALAINLPGTEYHHLAEIHGLNKQIGEEAKERQAEATTEAERGRTGLEAAQAGAIQQEEPEKVALQDAQIANLLHPQAKTDFEAWRQANPDAPVTDWLEAQAQAKPAGTRAIQREVNGQPHTIIVDERTGADIRDEGMTGEKPPTVSVNAGINEADKIAARVGKPYETAATNAQNKLDRIDQTSRSVDAGYVGQGLAIPELLTSLVSGQGTGVRITQPELNMITRHRGIEGDAESWFNSLAGKGNLTANDKAQIKNVLADAKVKVLEKIQLMNDAQDAINAATSREQVIEADKKYRAIQAGMEKFMEVRRDDQGNYFGSNDGGKTAYNLATGQEAK